MIVVEVNKQYRQGDAWILLWRICVDVDDDGGGSCFGNWQLAHEFIRGGANDVSPSGLAC